MKKITICFLGIFLFVFSLYSQHPSWVIKNPSTHINPFYSVYFTCENQGFIMTFYENEVYKTIDGGENWTLVLRSHIGFQKITFITDKKGIVIGEYGNIYKTEDAGETWELEKLDTNALLMDIFFVNENIGFILVYNSIILKTTDGGETWDSHFSHHTDMFTIFFSDENTGYMTGFQGRTRKTTDGGETWHQIHLPSTFSSMWSIHFFDNDNGFFLGGNRTLYKTSDGGENWEDISLGLFWGSFLKIFFTNSTTGYILGNYNLMLKTTDGGESWTELDLGPGPYEAFDFQFINENIGYVVGKDGLVLKTTDAGETWTDMRRGVTNRTIWTMSFGSSSTGYAGGAGGLLLKSTNHGKAWDIVETEMSHTISQIKFLNSNTGFINGPSSSGDIIILKTNDGAENWSEIIVQTEQGQKAKNIESLKKEYHKNLKESRLLYPETRAFISVDTFYVVGILNDQRALFKTYDSGATWTALPTNLSFHISSIDFLTADMGYAAGQSGGIARTYDGGESWEVVLAPTSNHNEGIAKLFFADETAGYAILQNKSIIKTIDSGESWFTLSPPIQNPNDIFFTDQNSGYIVGGFGGTIRTRNGGHTWYHYNPITETYLYTVYFKNEYTGFVAGENGVIVKARTTGYTNIDSFNLKESNTCPVDVFPNPANENINIELNSENDKISGINIYNMQGVIIAQYSNVDNKKTTIDVSNLSPGIYNIVVRSLENRIAAKRLVIIR